jgi:hypothetical protein
MNVLKKLGLLFGLVLAAWGIGATPSHAACTAGAGSPPPYGAWYIDADSGNDAVGNGCVFAPLKTLAYALSVANCGNSIIFVHGGAEGPVYLGCQIAIVGPGDDTLQIVANPSTTLFNNTTNQNNSTLFGCIGPTVGTCPVAGPGNMAVQIAAGPTTDSIKLKSLLVSMGSSSSATTALQVDSAFCRGIDRDAVGT